MFKDEKSKAGLPLAIPTPQAPPRRAQRMGRTGVNTSETSSHRRECLQDVQHRVASGAGTVRHSQQFLKFLGKSDDEKLVVSEYLQKIFSKILRVVFVSIFKNIFRISVASINTAKENF